MHEFLPPRTLEAKPSWEVTYAGKSCTATFGGHAWLQPQSYQVPSNSGHLPMPRAQQMTKIAPTRPNQGAILSFSRIGNPLSHHQYSQVHQLSLVRFAPSSIHAHHTGWFPSKASNDLSLFLVMLGVFSRVGLSVVRLMLGDPKTSTLSGNLGTQDGGSLEQSEEELGWDVFLRFRSRVLERRFRQQYNWASVECDKCTFSLMVLMGSMFVLCMLLVNGRNWGVTLFLGCIMVTMARLALIAFCRDWYETNRTMVLFCSHTLHSMLALMSSRSIPMPAYAEPEFLFAYLLRSPIMILLLVGFGMMIPFEVTHRQPHTAVCYDMNGSPLLNESFAIQA